ncbi:MAG: glycosyltransferase family 2 protein [Candidatus Omnitrophica bacterium]|nr:glycosyltransferase family 2 protein [Candidatus Omnitrophota bacterium]
MDLSVVIAFYREDKEILFQCLEAFRKSAEGISYEIIFINNSTQPLLLPADLIVINNPNNVGIAKARNQGVAIAKSSVIFLLEPDIIVSDLCVKKMFNFLMSRKDISAIAPKLISLDGSLQYNFRNLPSIFYPIYEILSIPVRNQKTQEGFYDFLGLGSLMFKKESWERVGPCDERFIYGFDDTDWCRRAKQKGLKLYYYPIAQAVHLLHKSVAASGGRQVDFYLCEVIYYTKHYGFLIGFLLKVFIILFSLLRILVLTFKPSRRATRDLLFELIKRLVFLK